ncbi:MAG: ankyrin repeat domain-containing protein [Proteobacteria bacterium]|nr:ankyrin repeat domain-containing protein [Pseudomonadota bacterium]
MSLAKTIIYGSLKELEIRLQQESNLNVIDEYGFTPLIQTAIINDFDKGELLLEHGADVNFRDISGASALHWTVENNNIPFSQLLLNYQADPNAYTLAADPVLVKPIMRKQRICRDMLVNAGASMDFANDYINTKLLGHRFELSGYVDIVDPKGRFVEVDLEGFILEFTIGIVHQSLEEYRNHFAARHLRESFIFLDKIVEAFNTATKLIKYQQYQTDFLANGKIIDDLLDAETLIIPIAYQGHAISLVKRGHILAKCDRSENDLFIDNVVLYQMTKPHFLTKDLLKQLMYHRQTKNFIDLELNHLLGLKAITKLQIGSQISGNCSWANIESCVPVIFYLHTNTFNKDHTREALSFYYQWLEWDKDRALQFCMKEIDKISVVRRISKATLLAAVLFQRCSAELQTDIERALNIIKLLKTPELEYLLKSYIEIYCNRNPSPAGSNLQKLLRLAEGYI